MTIDQFIERYREVFGEAAQLPIAFGYSNEPATEIRSVPNVWLASSVRYEVVSR